MMSSISQIFNFFRLFKFGKFDKREKLILSAIRYGYRQNQKVYWEFKNQDKFKKVKKFFKYKGKVYSKLLENNALKKDLEDIYFQVSKEEIYNDDIVQTTDFKNFENYKTSFRHYWKKIVTINGSNIDKLEVDEKKLFKAFVEGYVILKYLNTQRQDLSMMSLNNYFMIGSYISFVILSRRYPGIYEFDGYKDEMKSKIKSLKNFSGGSFYLFGKSLYAYLDEIKQLPNETSDDKEKIKRKAMELENELLSMDKSLLFYMNYLYRNSCIGYLLKLFVGIGLGFGVLWLAYQIFTSQTINFYLSEIVSFISKLYELCIK